MWGIHPTDLWDWLAAFDWSKSDNVLSSIVGVTVLAGIAWAAIRYLFNPFAAWLGCRRAQAKLLDKLACDSSINFVESLCGTAQFITSEDGREQRTYRLPGAWLMVDVKDNAVLAFSITITKRRLYFDTNRITFGQLKVKLGRDKFGIDTGTEFSGQRLWIGARRVGYLRHYYFGNPGGYQNYWLSYNGSGYGAFWLGSNPTGMIETGTYADANPPYASGNEPVDTSGITVNTITVLAPHHTADEYMKRDVLGADQDRTRLATTIKPPSNSSLWGRTRNRITLWRYRIQGKTYRP